MRSLISFTYDKSALLSPEDMRVAGESLVPYTEKLLDIVANKRYDIPEASLNVISDHSYQDDIANMANEFVHAGLKYVVVVGIGGSNLGTEAIYDGMVGKLVGFFPEHMPRLIFADTVSTDLIADITALLDRIDGPEEVLINVISKSGTTTETIANFEAIYQKLAKRFGEKAKDRVVVTADRLSPVWEKARKERMHTLDIPDHIGGRYSVFTAVGLFPLALAGINTSELIAGACGMRAQCLSEDTEENLAHASAVVTYVHWKHGIKMNNSFFFNPEFESLGKWYRQLMGESLGKEHTKSGEIIHTGITPLVSVGSTDLHSMAQLYLGGPRDKLTSFIYAPPRHETITVPDEELLGGVGGIAGKPLWMIMEAILAGTKKAYHANGLPFVEIELSRSEASLGAYMQFKMIEMMYLAELMGVNAFDQPKVEDYKKETRTLLNS